MFFDFIHINYCLNLSYTLIYRTVEAAHKRTENQYKTPYHIVSWAP